VKKEEIIYEGIIYAHYEDVERKQKMKKEIATVKNLWISQ
jgi:hypothetical protein